MTEKRFYSIGSSLYNNTQCISDKSIADFKSKDGCKKVCELLNELQDGLNFYKKQNACLSEQLTEYLDARKAYKDDWKACVSYCDTYQDEIYTYKDNIEGLKEENEELKKENKDLQYTIDKCNYDYIDYLEKQNEMLKERIEELTNNDKIVFMVNE